LALDNLPVQNRVLAETARALGTRHEEGMLATARLLAQGQFASSPIPGNPM
jgi:hypothetical protein